MHVLHLFFTECIGFYNLISESWVCNRHVNCSTAYSAVGDFLFENVHNSQIGLDHKKSGNEGRLMQNKSQN